jgi:D-glycero-D-manno-heptose 1,7-bisphosphate phosphatase
MLLDLMRCWRIDPERSLLVGDRDTDMKAARNAGIAGHLFEGGSLADFTARIMASGASPAKAPQLKAV